MAKGFKHGAGGGTSLNFDVKAYASQDLLPDIAKDNTVAVITETAIPGYGFANSNPFISQQEEDLLAGATLGNGFFSSSGSISSQDGSHPEKYTVDMIPVTAGKSYRFEYEVSASKEMWLCVAEYKGSSFSARVVLVSAINGTKQIGDYIPGTGVDGVKLSWRTFSGTDCTVSLYDSVERTDADTKNGTVWVSANSASPVSFNTLKKNTIMVYPGDVFQYEDGAWVKKNALFFQNGGWQTVWDGTLFDYGNEYTDYTGGFVYKKNGGNGLTVRKNTDGSVSLIPPGGENTGRGMYYTANKIDLTNYTALYFYGIIWNYEGNRAGIGVYSDIGDAVDSYRVSFMSGYRDTQNTEHILDISGLSGSFHIGAFCGDHSNYVDFTMCKLWLE